MRKLSLPHVIGYLVTTILLVGCINLSLRPPQMVLPTQPSPDLPVSDLQSQVMVAKIIEDDVNTHLKICSLIPPENCDSFELPKNSVLGYPITYDGEEFRALVKRGSLRFQLYRFSKTAEIDSVAVQTNDLRPDVYIADNWFVMVDKPNELKLLSYDLAEKSIVIHSDYLSDDVKMISRVISGKDGSIIAFCSIPIQIANDLFVQAWIVWPETGKVEEKLLPFPGHDRYFPPKSSQTDTKYMPIIMAVDQKLEKIVYSYNYVNTPGARSINTGLAVYSVKDARDVAVRKDLVFLPVFEQHEDVIFQGKFPVSGAGALILNIDNLHPLFDLNNLPAISASDWIRLEPHGENWVVGTIASVFLFSGTGELLGSYALPDEFLDNDYYQLVIEIPHPP